MCNGIINKRILNLFIKVTKIPNIFLKLKYLSFFVQGITLKDYVQTAKRKKINLDGFD